MRSVFIFTVILLCSLTANSQKGKPLKYSLSVELGKSDLIYSVVFDNNLKDTRYGLRAGAGSNFDKFTNVLMAMVGGYRLYGSGPHHLETGIDLHYLNTSVPGDVLRRASLVGPDQTSSTFYITFNGGYRLNGRKIVFRAGLAPGFTKEEFLLGIYLSVGLRF